MLVGKQFGRLTVLKEIRMPNGRLALLCKCICGKTRAFCKCHVLSGASKSCGCFRKEQQQQRSKDRLIGKRFGRLVAQKRLDHKGHDYLWQCLCDCGNIVQVTSYCLSSGNTQSCGCLWREIISEANSLQLVGKRFGKLTVISDVGRRYGQILWRCKCDCGKSRDVATSSLTRGATRSCGCLQSDNARKNIDKIIGIGISSVSKSGTLFLNRVEKKFRVKIEREFKLENRYFDGKVDAILIEIDCNYWHHKNRTDAVKNALARKYGFKLVRFVVNEKQEIPSRLKQYASRLEKLFGEVT